MELGELLELFGKPNGPIEFTRDALKGRPDGLGPRANEIKAFSVGLCDMLQRLGIDEAGLNAVACVLALVYDMGVSDTSHVDIPEAFREAWSKP